MNLLFDIDDTITRETEFMIENAPKFLKKTFNDDFVVINENGYDVSEVFGLREYLLSHHIPVDDIDLELKRINSHFWNEYFVKYMFYPLRDDASKIINELKARGFKINFASIRGKKSHEVETFFEKVIRTRVVPFLTKMQLKINHIPYDKLILVEELEDKLKIAEDLQAKIVFDDNVQVLENLNPTIEAVCIETPHNILEEFGRKDVKKVAFNYSNICGLDSLSGLKDNTHIRSKKSPIKNLKFYQKVYTESVYVFVRSLGKDYVLNRYKPIVLGVQNLPKDKDASVFVGNHRNIKDPLITISLLEHPVHFAALKRMFEYNENIFGEVGKNFGTLFTTFFVKSIGALPIARPSDTDYQITNLQTFKYFDDYLKSNSSIVVYPEGTLNRNPEADGKILPLKSNHSFKLAERGKGVVRPVAIVWLPENAFVEHKVIISFLPPIYTENLRAKEISEKWSEAMNTAIDSMDKIVKEMLSVSQITSSESAPKKLKK